MTGEIASRYGEALFMISQEDGLFADRKAQAQCLLDVLEENPELLLFFRAVKITDEEKKKMITETFKDMDPDLVHFLELLVDKDRTYYLKDILKDFIARCDEELGIVNATVESARRLPEEQMARIKAALEKQTGKTVSLVNKVDQKLIAGIKVTVGNRVTDVTMARSLEQMKETLLKGEFA